MKKIIKQIYRRDNKYRAFLFIDRDGVINYEVGYLHKINQIKMLPTVVKGIRFLNKLNIAVIVVTNQPVIAHGLIPINKLIAINNKINTLLNKQNAYIDAIYSCPHHPNGKVKSFTIICKCRKPRLKLVEEAIKDYRIKKEKVLGIIGDSTRDIKLGKDFGIKTVAVQTGYKGIDNIFDAKPDFSGKNFLEGINMLLNSK